MEQSIADIPEQNQETVITNENILGTPVTVDDIKNRLEENLYIALSDESDETTTKRIQSAMIYVGAIMRNFKQEFNLDNEIIRELVILNTIYEMHLSHGHEDAGREYRTKAKDLILVTYGDYKDADNQDVAQVQTASVTQKKYASPYREAFEKNTRGYW